MTIKFNKKVFAILLIVVFLAPQAMFAQANSNNVKAGAGFCNNLDKFLNNANDKASARQLAKDEKFAQRQSAIDAKRAENDKKLADLRAQALLRQNEKIDNISQKATTPEQQAALAEFKAGVSNAVSIRQAAMDAARNTYRSGVDKIIADRKTAINNAMSALNSSVEAAVAKAKSDCASGVDAVTVRTALQSAIKSARENFRTTVQSIGSIGDQIKTLVQARQDSYAKIKEEFKNTLESLKATLKAKIEANQ